MLTVFTTFEKNVSSLGEKPAFISLESGEERIISYKELWEKVCVKVNQIGKLEKHTTALLIYEDTIDFLTSFLACQRAGIIAIPMFYPRNHRHIDRLIGILNSSGCHIVYTGSSDVQRISESIHKLNANIHVSTLDGNEIIEKPTLIENDISFIQYTSGSTSNPKGVIVGQSNLMHNQKMLAEIFNCHENSMILSWLPFYHDMGLIGSLIHTLYIGCTCVLLTPSAVVSNPKKWFEAIQKYKVTHTGGPNFIYDMCNSSINGELSNYDLSSVQVMYNGSEPIKVKTVRDFIERFAKFGFNQSAFRVCYGLAEATLVVSGGEPIFSENLISSGKIASEIDVVFFDNEKQEVNLEQGEICLNGLSITEGYWKIDSSSYQLTHQGKTYFKTGDIGSLKDGELFVEGRLKEMLILNGQNIFPYDIENAISEEMNAISPNGVAIAEVDNRIFLFGELKRELCNETPDFYAELKNRINRILIESIGVEAEAVVLISPRSLPRTSSGKIMRVQIHELWMNNQLTEFGKTTHSIENKNVKIEWTKEGVEIYLKQILADALKLPDDSDWRNKTFFELGLSSIKGVEIASKLKKELELDVEVEQLFELNKLDKVVEYILNLNWLNNASSSKGKEISL